MRIEKLDQFSEGMFSVFPISSIQTGSSNYGGNTIVTSALTTKFVAGTAHILSTSTSVRARDFTAIRRIFLKTCEPVNLASRLPSCVVDGLIEKLLPRFPDPGDNLNCLDGLNCLNGSAPSFGLTADGQ
jgi:hypothetical protein